MEQLSLGKKKPAIGTERRRKLKNLSETRLRN